LPRAAFVHAGGGLAVVMAKRRLPVFPGELNQPILKYPLGHFPGKTDGKRKTNNERVLADVRVKKLFDLLTHYDIPTPAKDRWLRLAWCLAMDCVPGMQVVDRLPIRARPPGKWGLELSYRLCDEIDAIRAERRPRTGVKAAVEILQKRSPNEWGKYRVSTLETRYYELKKERRARDATGLLGKFSPDPRK
jgi:hypothetical protein